MKCDESLFRGRLMRRYAQHIVVTRRRRCSDSALPIGFSFGRRRRFFDSQGLDRRGHSRFVRRYSGADDKTLKSETVAKTLGKTIGIVKRRKCAARWTNCLDGVVGDTQNDINFFAHSVVTAVKTYDRTKHTTAEAASVFVKSVKYLGR